jgi:hypothetical protein
MASKYINGTYNAGYTLTGVYSAVTIGPPGSIAGAGRRRRLRSCT